MSWKLKDDWIDKNLNDVVKDISNACSDIHV